MASSATEYALRDNQHIIIYVDTKTMARISALLADIIFRRQFKHHRPSFSPFRRVSLSQKDTTAEQ